LESAAKEIASTTELTGGLPTVSAGISAAPAKLEAITRD
jgi:hypothetical protein